MAIVRCKDCGAQISRNATACPRCGAPNPGPAQAIFGLVAIAVLAWVGLSLVLFAQYGTTSPCRAAAHRMTESTLQENGSHTARPPGYSILYALNVAKLHNAGAASCYLYATLGVGDPAH